MSTMFFEISAEEASTSNNNDSSQPLLESQGNDMEQGHESLTSSSSLVAMDSMSVRQWAAVALCVFLAFPIFSAGIVETTKHVSSISSHHDHDLAASRLVSLMTVPLSPIQSQHDQKQAAFADSSSSSSGMELDISVLGDPVNIWRSSDTWHSCHIVDVPDIPTRAFWVHNDNTDDAVNDNGKVRMIQGSTDYHVMSGPSLFNVTRDCHATWNHTANPNPALFAANEFLDSPFAFANGTVVAMAHTEYPGDRYHNCPGPAYPYCWTVTMGLMLSHDHGITWDHAQPPPHHLVAAVPYTYDANRLAYGWGDPTNILAHPTDGYYYMAAWNRNTVGWQSAGVCMMRTRTLLDPSSWRAWNGNDYNVSFVSPYTENNDDMNSVDPKDHICTVLNVDATVLDPTQCNPFGLVWSPSLQLFIMTWACLMGNGPFYLTTSENLIQWSAPQFLYDRSMLPKDVQENVTSLHYPNLMDVTAPRQFQDHNYNTIGTTPHLFWVSIGHSPYTDGRSAWATPLKLARKQNHDPTEQQQRQQQE